MKEYLLRSAVGKKRFKLDHFKEVRKGNYNRMA